MTEQQEEQVYEEEDPEQIDGVRMAFNVWPSTRLEQVKYVQLDHQFFNKNNLFYIK